MFMPPLLNFFISIAVVFRADPFAEMSALYLTDYCTSPDFSIALDSRIAHDYHVVLNYRIALDSRIALDC